MTKTHLILYTESVIKLQNYIISLMFYDHEIHQRKLSVKMSGFYHAF